MRSSNIAVATLAVALGAGIAYVDSRPGWDDTGVTAGAVFVAAAALSFLRPRLCAAIIVAVGAPLPLIEITRGANYGSLLALAIAVVGAVCGAGARAVTASGTPA